MANFFDNLVSTATKAVSQQASSITSSLTAQAQQVKAQAEAQIQTQVNKANQAIDKLKGQIDPAVDLIKLLSDPAQRFRIIESIKLETNILPPIEVLDPFGPSAPKPAGAKGIALGAMLKALAPSLTIQLKTFGPLTVAPMGKPNPEAWKPIAFGVTIGGGVLVYLLLRGLLVRRRSLSGVLGGVKTQPRRRRRAKA
jgi:hypothetical protein